MSESKSKTNKIFVGGLSWNTSDQAFQNYFSKFGEIKESIIMRDRASQTSRGFGFVTFVDHATVDKVMAARDIVEIDGRKVDVKPAIPRDEISGAPSRVKKIFVGGLSRDLSEQEFRAHFAQFGTVKESSIMTDSATGRSRGFGFITFDSEDAVDLVLSKDHMIGGKQVECKRAVPKTAEPRRGSASGGYGNGGGYGGGYGSGGYGGYNDLDQAALFDPYARGYGSIRPELAFDPYGLGGYPFPLPAAYAAAALGGARGAVSGGRASGGGVRGNGGRGGGRGGGFAASYSPLPSYGAAVGRVAARGDRSFHPY